VNRALLLLPLAFALACTTPHAEGERLYREGDRLGALEAWRAIPESNFEYQQAQERIGVVEAESDGLVTRYKQRARYFEGKERLAESILDYRLALKLQPDDAESLAHVQELARTLARRKAALSEQYDAAMAESDLASAREHLDQQRKLDPFDPTLQTEERALNDAIRPAVTQGLAAGRRLFIAGNLEAAQKRFHSVLELAPHNESAQGYISYISTIQRERQAASARSATFSSRESFASDDEIRAEGFYQNALAAERRGDLYDAIRLDQRALKANAGHAGAKRHLKTLRGRLSGSSGALIEAGRRAYREEDLQTALELWSKVLLIDPDNQRARAYADRAQRQLQNLERLRAEPDVAGRIE
jgi:tetratricopeptide (TPR) repeat protein